MGLISRVSSRTYRSVQTHYLRRQNGPIHTSSICPYQGAPGQRPAQVPYQREQPPSQELAETVAARWLTRSPWDYFGSGSSESLTLSRSMLTSSTSTWTSDP